MLCSWAFEYAFLRLVRPVAGIVSGFDVEAWISAMVYLTCWPLIVSSIARYLIFPPG